MERVDVIKAPIAGWTWESFSQVLGDALAVASADLAGVELHPEDHLLDDLGLDSFGVLVLIRELEDQLGVECPPIEEEPTLQNLYRLVAELSREPPARVANPRSAGPPT